MSMSDFLPLVPLFSVIVGVVGWFAAHSFNVFRDRNIKRRDMIVQYRLEAYRRLESAANRDKSEEQALAFESAVADIQLLGSSEEIEITVKYLKAHAANSGGTIDDVLCLLRSNLRKELGLASPPGKPVFFRFERKLDSGDWQGNTVSRTESVRAAEH